MSDIPEVVAAPGLALAEVRSRSTAQLTVPPTLTGMRPVQVLQVHRFTVPHAEHGLTVGPGLFGLLQVRDGVVECVHISPHVGYLQGAACVATLDTCAVALTAVNWRRDRYSGEEAYARTSMVGEALAGEWFTERLHARLTLRRVHEVDSAAGRLFGLKQDVFVATLRIGALR